MAKTLEDIINSLRNLCDKEIHQKKVFGIEFGTDSLIKIQSTNVKGIVVSPFVNLKLTHFMKDNKANLAITVLPLSIVKNKFPLSERDFELLRSLVLNNLKTARLPEEWLYISKGAFPYFLQTLGISKTRQDMISLHSEKKIPNWVLSSIAIDDFLNSLSHLCKKWMTYSYAPENAEISLVLEKRFFTLDEIKLLKENGVNTVLSFALDSRSIPLYKENKMNILYLPFLDYCNLSLRKFSQLLQLESDVNSLFYPQETDSWLSYKELKDKSL